MAKQSKEQRQIDIDKVLPPADDTVIVGELGAVMMNVNTFHKLSDAVEEAAIKAGRTGEE